MRQIKTLLVQGIVDRLLQQKEQKALICLIDATDKIIRHGILDIS